MSQTTTPAPIAPIAPIATAATDGSPPPGFTVEYPGHRLRVVFRWRSLTRLWTITLGTVGVGGSIVSVTLLAHNAGWIDALAAGVINTGLLTLVLAVGVLLWTSRTVLEIGDGVIRARHRRHLLPSTRALAVDDVAQLFCVRVRGADGATTFFRFHLIALLSGGRKAILVPNLERRGQALFLERVAEDHLGIVNRPVRGELRQVAPRFQRSPRDRKKPIGTWRFGWIMQGFMSHPILSRRGRFVRDIRFMLTGKEFRIRPRRK